MLSTYKKPALVLIISAVLFTGIVYLLDFEPLDFIRTHFYNPSFINSIVKENEKASEIVQKQISELQNKFKDTLDEAAVKSSFLYNQTAADIYERSRVFGILVESVSGLQSVQFVDNNGVRIHYSTSNRDVVSLSSNSATYRNYTDDSRVLPYEDVSVKANENPKYIMDATHDRIIFSFPFYDSMNVYRGTALFTLSVRAIAERLVAEGCLKPADDVSVIRLPRGIVFGTPNTSKAVILTKISAIWSESFQEYITLDAEDSGIKYALISIKTGNDLFFGRIINDSFFTIPESMKFVFQLSLFLTLFLTLYFLTNIKPHPVTLVQHRIKALRTSLFEQLYIKKTGQDRAKWILELEQRRDEIRRELKSRLKIKRSLEIKIDGIIDKAWDELLAVMKSGYDLASLEKIVKNRAVKVETVSDAEADFLGADSVADVEEFVDAEPAEALEEIPADASDADAASPAASPSAASSSAASSSADGEVEALEEADEIDETGDDIDEIDEAEELEEELDEAEELAEEIEEFEEIEEEIEEFEEADEDKTYTEIKLSKGLLKAANETLSKIKKKEPSAGKEKEQSGLLNLAAGFLNSIDTKKTEEKDIEILEEIEELEEIKEVLEEIEDEEEETPPAKGLLAAASSYSRGHAALAAENFSVREIDSDASEPEDSGQGLLLDMEVFSPFSSMFNTLENKKDNA